jgi:ubiquinone/menaquinone biosynthesis C-methylase UbiE
MPNAMFSDPVDNIRQFMLGEGMIVADLGAGSGAYTLAAAGAIGRTGRVYAVEIQADLLTRIASLSRQNGFHNVEVLWGDVEYVGGSKLATESVDAVITANLFFQVNDKRALATEIRRILRPGGKALVVDWLDSFEGVGPQQEYVVLRDTAHDMFVSEGLACGESIRAGEHHWGMICRKR